jgi:hypothetical protein
MKSDGWNLGSNFSEDREAEGNISMPHFLDRLEPTLEITEPP